jgi:uncharacterized protein YjgD (DUF1641 family)
MDISEIIKTVRSLPAADQRKILEELQKDLRQKTDSAKTDEETKRRLLEWLKKNRDEYAGQYVALDGDRLVGHAATIREARKQAQTNGVEDPFLVRLEKEETVLPAGW